MAVFDRYLIVVFMREIKLKIMIFKVFVSLYFGPAVLRHAKFILKVDGCHSYVPGPLI